MTQQADAGRRVGRFEIIKRLGGGGLTDAFLARPIPAAADLRFVALKQLSATARGNEATARAYLEDARVTAGLMHAHVARVFNAAVDPARGEPYLAVEFVPGADVKTLVEVAAQRGFQLPLHIACRVVHDVCLGLHAGHLLAGPTGRRLGVVHGSVTPGNVMVAWTGQVKLLDFGLSRARALLRQAFPGQLFGTLAYSSPEQILDHPMEPRSDVFSAGTLLFELLTGRRMHESEAAAPRAVVMDRPPPPSSLAADVPAKLDAAVLAALEKNVDDRPASAADFAGAIAAAATLAEDSEVAALMEALFEERRRALDALLARWSRDEDDEEETTVSMTVPVPPDTAAETDWPAPPVGASPWEATQQLQVAPVPSQARRAAPEELWAAPPPPTVNARAPRPLPAEELFAPPPPPATAKARPAPAEELFAPPPPPATAKARPPPPDELFAPPPPPATAKARPAP
ncbi:MAG: serine/threonine-protein kinase, partial [Myxococcota bacterium]